MCIECRVNGKKWCWTSACATSRRTPQEEAEHKIRLLLVDQRSVLWGPSNRSSALSFLILLRHQILSHSLFWTIDLSLLVGSSSCTSLNLKLLLSPVIETVIGTGKTGLKVATDLVPVRAEVSEDFALQAAITYLSFS